MKSQEQKMKSNLPTDGYLRLYQIIGDRSANPPIPPIIPVGRSTWWAGVKSGKFPLPIKIGIRITAWRVEDIQNLIDTINKRSE